MSFVSYSLISCMPSAWSPGSRQLDVMSAYRLMLSWSGCVPVGFQQRSSSFGRRSVAPPWLSTCGQLFQQHIRSAHSISHGLSIRLVSDVLLHFIAVGTKDNLCLFVFTAGTLYIIYIFITTTWWKQLKIIKERMIWTQQDRGCLPQHLPVIKVHKLDLRPPWNLASQFNQVVKSGLIIQGHITVPSNDTES